MANKLPSVFQRKTCLNGKIVIVTIKTKPRKQLECRKEESSRQVFSFFRPSLVISFGVHEYAVSVAALCLPARPQSQVGWL